MTTHTNPPLHLASITISHCIMLKLEATNKIHDGPKYRAEAKTIPRPKGNQSRDDQAQAKLATPPRLSLETDTMKRKRERHRLMPHVLTVSPTANAIVTH
jgi:hypothetical protein